MKQVWYIANCGLVMLSWKGGYDLLSPDNLLHANPDPIFCLAIFVMMVFFTLGCVYYSTLRWGPNTLRRPSWHRNPIRWWTDPLQSLFISTCTFGAAAVGAALRGSAIGSVGFWLTGAFFSSAFGLLVGQLLVYRIYKREIVNA
jgi:hypothetical protein